MDNTTSRFIVEQLEASSNEDYYYQFGKQLGYDFVKPEYYKLAYEMYQRYYDLDTLMKGKFFKVIEGFIETCGSWFCVESSKTNEAPKPRLIIQSNNRVLLYIIGAYLKDKLLIIPKISESDKLPQKDKSDIEIDKTNVLLYGGREITALAFFLYKERNNFPDNIKELTKGVERRKCSMCGNLFVRTAGLQDICRSCKKEVYPHKNKIYLKISV